MLLSRSLFLDIELEFVGDITASALVLVSNGAVERDGND
tara:strand:- start:27 stop:143 length:117 start_codon:yes stop_codon:yes gene_type:complete